MNDESKLDKILAAEFAEDTMDLKSKLKAITGTSTIEKNKSPLKLLMPILAIAAGLALALIFLPGLFQDKSAEALYASYYEPYPMALNQRGEGDAKLNEAIATYTEENYEAAAANFKAIFVTTGENVQLLYAASAEQALGNYQSAIELYDQILAKEDPKVTEQAQWYKALSLLKMGQESEAKLLLTTFATSHYKYEEAQKIID